MLGFGRKNEPFVLKGVFAKRFAEQLQRYATGNYNRADLLRIAWDREKSDIEIVCEDEPKTPYVDVLAEQIHEATSKYIVFINPTVRFDYKTEYKGMKMKLIEGYAHACYKLRTTPDEYTFVICGTDKDKILNDSIEFFKKQYEDFEKTKKLVYIKLTKVDKRHDTYTKTDYTSVSYQMYIEKDWNER